MVEKRKLTRTGGNRSMSVIIPAQLVKSLGWRDRQKVLIKKSKGAIFIRDAKTKKRKRK